MLLKIVIMIKNAKFEYAEPFLATWGQEKQVYDIY